MNETTAAPQETATSCTQTDRGSETPRIILTLAPATLDLSRWEDPLCVFSDHYQGLMGCPSMPFEDFAEAPRDAVADYETVLFLGLTDMMTPSNRTDSVWEFTFNQMETPSVSIDRFLFKTDPWRAWFHFGLTNAEYRDYTYSYLAESDYDQFFNGQREEDPFSLDEIRTWGDGVIESHYVDYFRDFEIDVGYEATPAEEYEYSELLDELFETKNTIGQVRRELESYCDEIYPEREVPKRYQLFNGDREWHLQRTNLPIDDWKASRLTHLVELTNQTLEAFHAES